MKILENMGDYYGVSMEQAYFGENLGDYYGECMEQAKSAKCPVSVCHAALSEKSTMQKVETFEAEAFNC